MAQLEYDDSGSTFYYFLISFYALVLLPLTYFLWPRRTDGAFLQMIWWVLNRVMFLLAFLQTRDRRALCVSVNHAGRRGSDWMWTSQRRG